MKLKNNLPFFILTLILFVLPPILFAAPLKRPLRFQQMTPKEGLSGEMVYAIAIQGDELWFGTYAGGATFYDRSKNLLKAYTTKGEPMDPVDDGVSIHWKNLLPYNHVTVILPDVDRIWFGTHFYGFRGGGISYYQRERQPPWKVFNTNNGRAKKIISMALDGDTLWVGSEKGLNALDKKTETWKRFFSTQEGLSGNFVNTLLVQSDSLWVGTNGGVSRLLKGKKGWKNYSQGEGLGETEIKSLIIVENRIWAGESGGGLFEYDPREDRWKRFESRDPLKNGGINSMAVIRGRVFVCRENGVSIFDLETRQWESFTMADGLLSNMVLCTAEDRDGVWFGTDRGATKLILNP